MSSMKLILLGSLLMTVVISCDPYQHEPVEDDGNAPEEIKNVVVENLAGSAKITYSLPLDLDLLYVEAIYKNKVGSSMNFKSSHYTNFLVVDGFADTTSHDVEIYAVDKSGNRSTPVVVQVKPKTPPVIVTYRSLTIQPDFGGVSVSFKNKDKVVLDIVVTTSDANGKSVVAKTFHTTRDSASFSVRGFTSEPRMFKVFVRDRWGNTSETLATELTPLFEMQLDKNKFSEFVLPGDAGCTSWGGAMLYAWDGKVPPDGPGFGLHTGNAGTGVPKVITFDMGVEAKLSRFSLQTVPDYRHWFNDVSMKRYELWGSINPATDGSFDGWTKLLTVTNIKPSGLPVGAYTDDDRTAGLIGDEANFSTDSPRVRYIRIRCLENWSGNTNMVISEMTFWGSEN